MRRASHPGDAGVRTVGVVSVGRSDYSYYVPILRQMQRESALRVALIVAGMHLSPQFGLSVERIEADGFEIADRIEMLLASDTPEAVAKSIGLGVLGFAQSYVRLRPTILLLLGDRFEMLSAAVAALPLGIPIAHIAGGESTEGLIDESVRHAITKMSHLHFVSTEDYGRRVVQMGEEPWRVTVTGAPSLDNLHRLRLLKREEVAQRIECPLDPPPLVVTFHPVTLEAGRAAEHVEELLSALSAVGRPLVFTFPNADAEHEIIIERLKAFVASHRPSCLVTNLGTELYYSLLKYAGAMVGNSSSGVIEAASFALPVVNIGVRQRGRIHGANVVDVACERSAIVGAIRHVCSDEFQQTMRRSVNIYGDGYAAARIVDVLRETPIDDRLLMKAFHQL